jgi:predicted ester cyclase
VHVPDGDPQLKPLNVVHYHEQWIRLGGSGSHMSDNDAVGHEAVGSVRSAVAALNGGDIAGYIGYFDPSGLRWVAGVDRPLSLAEVHDGLVKLRTAFEDLRLDEELLFGDQRFACAQWRMRARHVNDYEGFVPLGKDIDVATCEIYEVRDNRVVTTWTYGDLGQLFRQIAGDGKDAS